MARQQAQAGTPAQPKAMNQTIQGTFWILATALLWSALGLLGKTCLTAGMPPLESAFFRAFFGCSAFFIHCAVSGHLRIPAIDAAQIMLFGAWGIGAYFAFMQYTILLAGAAMDIVLQYTAPFWVALFAWWFFGERLTRVKAIAIAAAAAGTVCVCLSGGSIPGPVSYIGIVTGLLSGLCYATQFPFTRWGQKRYSPDVLFAWMLAGGTLVLGALNAAVVPFRIDFPPAVWMASLSMGVLCTYLAFICYAKALERISLVQAVVTAELEPVLSMLWVWLAFNESFSPIGWIGSALIVLSVLFMSLFKSNA